MPIAKNLMGSGCAGGLARRITGGVTTSLTAAGSAQTDALAITDDINIVTTAAASTGVRLRSDLISGDSQEVVNYGANTLNVYPPTGGKINNGSANAAVTVAANASAIYTCINGTDFFGVKTA